MISISHIMVKNMRALVDVGDSQLRELDQLSREEKRSRAALIREAIDDFLATIG